MKNKVGKQHGLPICWFFLGDWDIFEKEGTSEKGCVETDDWGFSVHFVFGCQENSIYTLHLCFKLRYYIQNGAKFLQKLTPGFKNQKFDGLLLSKKYIPSARTLHT